MRTAAVLKQKGKTCGRLWYFLRTKNSNDRRKVQVINSELAKSLLHSIKQQVGPCKRIRISESGKFLLVKSEILGFGIWNTAQGIRNPRLRLESSTWNPESTAKNQESKAVYNYLAWGQTRATVVA